MDEGRCPSLEEIEQRLAADGDSAELEQHLARCPRCQHRTQQIQEDDCFLADLRDLKSLGPDANYSSSAGTATPEAYEIERELHRGGQGVVYEARHKETGRRVALKMLLAGRFATSVQRRRFERETELVESLNHAAIVNLHASGSTPDGHPYLAMEFIDGQELSTWLFAERSRRKNHPLGERLELFLTICQAMEFAHQHGVIHRDLKPSNILVDGSGKPHVLDFGLAKHVGLQAEDTTQGLTRSGEFMGSLAWAAPEQVRGNIHQIDTRTDVYALGMILYHLVTYQHPYDLAGSISEAVETIVQVRPRPPSRCLDSGKSDWELDAIVLKALEKNPAERYPSVHALAEDCQRYLRGQRVHAAEWKLGPLLVKTVRRHPFAILATVLVLSAGWLGQHWLENQRRNEEQDRRQQVEAASQKVMDRRATARDQKGGTDPALWALALEDAEALRRVVATLLDDELVARPHRRLSDDVEEEWARLQEKDRQAQQERRVRGLIQTILTLNTEEYVSFAELGASVEQQAREVLAESGIRPEEQSLEEACTVAAASPLAKELAAILDRWAEQRLQENDFVSARKLMNIAQAADLDPERGEIRDAIVERDCDALTSLGRELDEEADLETVWLLSDALLRCQARMVARTVLTRARRRHPHDFPINFQLFLLEVEARRPADAVEYGQIALILRPESTFTRLQLGYCFLQIGKARKALDLLEAALEEVPENEQLQRYVGRAHMRLGHWVQAEAAFRAATEKWPDNARYYILLGQALEKQGQTAAAHAMYLEGVDLHVSVPRLLMDQVDQELDQAAVEQALTNLSTLDFLAPDHPDTQRRRAWTLAYLGRTTEAEQQIRRTVLQHPRDALCLATASFVLSLDPEGSAEALTFAERAAGLRPEDPFVLACQGAALLRSDEPERALELLERDDRRRSRKASASGWAQFFECMAHASLGQQAEAAKTLHNALLWIDDPNHPGRSQSQAFLRLRLEANERCAETNR